MPLQASIFTYGIIILHEWIKFINNTHYVDKIKIKCYTEIMETGGITYGKQ